MNLVEYIQEKIPEKDRPHGYIVTLPPNMQGYTGALHLNDGCKKATVFFLANQLHCDAMHQELAVYADFEGTHPIVEALVTTRYPQHFYTESVQEGNGTILNEREKHLFLLLYRLIYGALKHGIIPSVNNGPPQDAYVVIFDQRYPREVEELTCTKMADVVAAIQAALY